MIGKIGKASGMRVQCSQAGRYAAPFRSFWLSGRGFGFYLTRDHRSPLTGIRIHAFGRSWSRMARLPF